MNLLSLATTIRDQGDTDNIDDCINFLQKLGQELPGVTKINAKILPVLQKDIDTNISRLKEAPTKSGSKEAIKQFRVLLISIHSALDGAELSLNAIEYMKKFISANTPETETDLTHEILGHQITNSTGGASETSRSSQSNPKTKKNNFLQLAALLTTNDSSQINLEGCQNILKTPYVYLKKWQLQMTLEEINSTLYAETEKLIIILESINSLLQSETNESQKEYIRKKLIELFTKLASLDQLSDNDFVAISSQMFTNTNALKPQQTVREKKSSATLMSLINRDSKALLYVIKELGFKSTLPHVQPKDTQKSSYTISSLPLGKPNSSSLTAPFTPQCWQHHSDTQTSLTHLANDPNKFQLSLNNAKQDDAYEKIKKTIISFNRSDDCFFL